MGNQHNSAVVAFADVWLGYRQRVLGGGFMTQTLPAYHSLVVEDDVIFRTTLMAVLQQADYVPFGTGTGQETLAFLQQSDTPPHVILLDHQLPDMTATELYEAIQQDQRIRAVPVCCSALAQIHAN
jgi:CheY-like chemotaxis protein